MADMRRALTKALQINEKHVSAVQAAGAVLTAEEAAVLESLRKSPVFAGYPKDQLDRHTLRAILGSISTEPISLLERVANKIEKLMATGLLNEKLQVAKGRSLTEAEVPEERPASQDGKGEMPQGPADSTASEHDSKDVGPLAKDAPSGAADKGADQDKEKHGDKSDVAKDGYMKEDEDSEDDEEEMEEADPGSGSKDNEDPQLGEEEAPKDAKDPAPAKDDRSPKDAGKLAEEEDEDDEEEEELEAAPPAPAAAPAAPAAAPAAPAPKAEKCKEARRSLKAERRAVKESLRKLCAEGKGDSPAAKALREKQSVLKCSIKSLKNSIREAEEVAKDAKEPASDPEHRAANDATYKDGKGQNEAEEKPETKDVENPPDLSNVKAEDPSNSELNKGPVSPAMESLTAIEERICAILRENGILPGSAKWTEAYVRGWSLAMEYRAKKISETK